MEAVVNKVDNYVNNVLNADAVQLSKMIRNKEISVSTATQIYIDRIKEKNPTVNFLTEDRFAFAVKEAEKADENLAKGQAEGALFGVPISMKESFDVQNMQTTGGLKFRKGLIQNQDAEVVARLRAEGAIILGKTNTPELCFCQETDNKLYGRTNNPRDLKRTVGGSSGGEGAAIALAAAAVGLGSDIGGSIRFPSHFNGVVGFKSGKGQVSQVGSFPYVENELQQRMLGIGPISKSVRDAKLVYDIIADDKPKERNLEDFSVNVYRTTEKPISSETLMLLNQIYLHLKNNKFHFENNPIPLVNESALLWQEIMSIDGGESTRKIAFDQKSGNPYAAYLKEKTMKNAPIHRYLSWALIGASLFKPSAKRINEINHLIKNGDAILDEYLEGRLVIMPVYHTAAPLHGAVYKEIFSIRKTFLKYMPFVAYANTWGLPALTVPVGSDKDGMPIAVQIIGKNGNEDAIFKLGSLIEKEFDGYKRAD
ncbi:amidase [Sporosarcina highlanderae]|uniref:Amidase n=1 Tax=Sporosarcina highlanderae TaxID=3035916 RepID=A0ABT8JR85_9BACL|nr:amidase [Sporosarcina highlanderae]MDN4607660.1 amidase [Sporosarcina highlanderae]